MRLAAAILLAPALLSAQNISGRVVNAVTGEPIRRASVALTQVDGPPTEYSAVSDANGQFSFSNLPPGSYRTTTTRNGFLSPGPGKPFSFAAGQSLSDLTVKLTPEAIVTGRIVDEEGEPMRNVFVSLQSYSYLQGRKQLISLGGSSTTNDLGEYRVFGVAPGRYYLSAALNSRPLALPVVRPVAAAEQAYVTTYYPGTADSSASTAIQVTAGAQLRGIDMAMMKSRTFHVRGRVTHGMEGRPNVSIVQLAARGNAFLAGVRTSAVDAAGGFDIGGVAPGLYTLFATFNDSTGARRARIPVDVRGDVDGLALTAVPDVSVKGRIVSDPGAPPVPLSSVRVNLQPREFDGFSGGTASGRPDEEGDFEIARVPADRYLILCPTLPPGAYVKSARSEQSDILADGLDLTGGAVTLTVVISPRGATVTGTVDPPGATVVLIPREKERVDQPLFYKTAAVNQTGAFSITGIAPGEYRLYAWETVHGEAYFDPEFVNAFEGKGAAVAVRESEQKTVALRAIPADN